MAFFGEDLKTRIDLLGLDVSTLAKKTFIDEDLINKMISNSISYEEVDEFDMSLLCDVLHCNPKYFIDNTAKNSDLIFATMNRGCDSIKSRTVKAKIQDFINDYFFINGVLNEA